jgi:polyhydroxyalkanoate synthase
MGAVSLGTAGGAKSRSRLDRDETELGGTARLYRFRLAGAARARGRSVLLVPSLINRWYVLDLQPGASVAEALVRAGLDVYCLDWGEPNDEDRWLGWDAIVSRLGRAVRRVARAGGERPGLLGYCIGGTLASIHTALEPESVRSLVNLAGPIDFSHAGFLGHMVDPRWFDPDAIAAAGNMSAAMMQSGFVALRPTAQIAKWATMLDRLGDAERTEAFVALDGWASDNIAFPAAAYARYIRELYQENRLARGEHVVGGRAVDLGAITCPLLTVTTTRDTICPPDAALALAALAGSGDKRHVSIPGGHVGAVVGDKAKNELYPALVEFFLTV